MSPKLVNRDEKIQNIIEAAVLVMARKGYHNTKIEEIAREAGVGKGTVYEYFSSKEALFEEMIDFNLQEDENYLLTLKTLSLEERLSEIIEYAFEMKEEKRNMHKCFSVHAWAALTNNDNNFLKEKMKNYYDRYIQLAFDFMKDRFQCSEDELIMKCRLFFAIMDGLFIQSLIYPEIKKQKDLIIKNMIQLFKN